MDPEVFGGKHNDHILGKTIHEYLAAFAKKYNVLDKIRFSTKVEEVQQDTEQKWIIRVTGPDGAQKKILANKLIVATGLTGNPNMPEIPGVDVFDGPVYHAKEFLQNKGLLHTAKTVAVYGASKSGWDAVYAYASAGVQVEWVVRESGRGPCWMAPMWVIGGKKWLEALVFTRLMTWLNPTVWGANDGFGPWKRFLHGSFMGRLIVNKFWNLLEQDVLDYNQFDSHPEMKKLKPWSGSFWSGTSLSILNYPTDFYDLVRNGTVRVHIGDITRLSPHQIHLSTGETIEADALHCSTGWKHEPPIKFSPPLLATKLGYPGSYDPSDAEMTAKIDKEIISRFPMLKNQPNVTPNRDPAKGPLASKEMPYRLYRYTVPPATAHDRNFAVAGAFLSLGQPVAAQLQALWITAYLDGSLPLTKSKEDMIYETELFQRFGHWRFPGGYGGKVGDFVFETLPYYDDLLGDLGLKFKRKNGWYKEITEPYGPKDYKGIVNEWIEKNRVEKKEEA